MFPDFCPAAWSPKVHNVQSDGPEGLSHGLSALFAMAYSDCQYFSQDIYGCSQQVKEEPMKKQWPIPERTLSITVMDIDAA